MNEFPKVIREDRAEIWDEGGSEFYAECNSDEDVARRFVAIWNATRHIPLEELERSGLAEHDAEVCRLQREACAAGFNEFDWEAIGVLGKCGFREYVPKKILATPAPGQKETE